MNPMQRDLTQTTLAVLFIGILIAASFWVMRPFLSAVIWATMVVVATWPRHDPGAGAARRQAFAGRRRDDAEPAAGAAGAAVAWRSSPWWTTADRIVGWSKWLAETRVPPPPDWVAGDSRGRRQAAAVLAAIRRRGHPGFRRSSSRLTPRTSPTGSPRKWAASACCSSSFCSPWSSRPFCTQAANRPRPGSSSSACGWRAKRA